MPAISSAHNHSRNVARRFFPKLPPLISSMKAQISELRIGNVVHGLHHGKVLTLGGIDQNQGQIFLAKEGLRFSHDWAPKASRDSATQSQGDRCETMC